MAGNKRIWKPMDFLDFWQECHGKLHPKWQRAFLQDPRVNQLCKHEVTENLLVAIRRNKKISDVLKDLENQSLKYSEFQNKLNPWKDSIPEQSNEFPKTYNGWYRWGGRWRKGF